MIKRATILFVLLASGFALAQQPVDNAPIFQFNQQTDASTLAEKYAALLKDDPECDTFRLQLAKPSKLVEQGKAYQGLAYRQAAKNLEKNDSTNRYHKFIFCGFNALNSAETFIFSKLCEAGKAEMLWDADTYYLDSTVQEAGLFLRRNQKVFGEKNFNFIHSYFKEEKQIDIIAVPKQIGQAQTVSKVIDDLIKQGESPDTIAVVLANEKMLWPVLKLLPNSIEHVNITMEYPVKYTSPFSFIDNLLKLQVAFENQNRSNPTIYYKDFLSLLRHNFLAELSLIKSLKNTNEIIHRILDKKLRFYFG